MTTRPRHKLRRWLLLFFALAFSGAIVAGNPLPGIWFELTNSRGHDLSVGTRSLLSSLKEPMRLQLFVAEGGAARVRAMLGRFATEAHGKLGFELVDSLPASRQDGAGVAVLASTPQDDALLEHAIAQLIYRREKPPHDAAGWRYPTLSGKAPLVIAHRGASSLFPEHTIAGYLQAIKDGAACIEPDLVMTRDGVLVARHDIYLSTTTDVARHPELAARRRKGTQAPYTSMNDWWASDFTLAEIRTLRAIQPFAGRSRAFDELYTVPTFAEVLDLALRERTVTGKPVCVYAEAKAPALHESLGLDIGGEILRVLAEKGLDKPRSPIFIQSFEPAFLKSIAPRTRLPLVLLVFSQCDIDDAMKLEGAPFWNVLGPTHQMLFDWRGHPTDLIRDAHRRGIAVHAWTYRDDAPFWGEDAETSLRKALALGLDGFFTDFPFTGYRVVNDLATSRP